MADISSVFDLERLIDERRAAAPLPYTVETFQPANENVTAPVMPELSLLQGFVFDGASPIAPSEMLVKGLLPMEGIGIIGGQSGAGKTFVLISLAVCLGSGTPFFGRKVRERVGLAVLAAEGASTLALRVRSRGETS